MGVIRCLQALVYICIGKFAVLPVAAQNLIGIINPGSKKIIINKLARDLFWFGLVYAIALFV